MIMDWILGITNAVAETAGDAANAVSGAEDPQQISTVAALLQLLLPMLVMIAVFYFLLIRPQRKKDKKVKDMLASLKPGDRVTTIGGIYGTITAIRENTITLAVGSQRTEMVFARWGIRQVEEVTVENDGEILN